MPTARTPGAVTVQTSFRFSPHVLVFPLVILITLPVLRELLVSWNYWWHGPSYRQVTYVMDEFRPNGGSPYIAGHFAGETDQYNLVGLERAGRQLVKALPSLAFSPGATVPVWHSPEAPMTVYFGAEANLIPVAARPALPGAGTFATYLAAEAVIVCNPLTRLDNVREMAEDYTAAWCSRDAGAVASFFAPEGSRTVNGGRPAKGREAIAAAAQEFMTAFPDLEVALDNLVDRGDRFVYTWTLTGTNSGPGGMGHPVKISGTDTWRLNGNGDIVESQGRFDQADYDRQVMLGQRE